MSKWNQESSGSLKSVSALQTHEITNHNSQKTKLFHLYYMKLLHDKFSCQEKEIKISYTSISKISIYLFKHFFFFRFISTQFADFASLKIQMQITFAKPFKACIRYLSNFHFSPNYLI